MGIMNFEFDPGKSLRNQEKHGINFVQGQKLWEDPKLITLKAKLESEARTLNIGKIGDRLWTAIATYRGENIRIISIRRARENEKALYQK